MPGWTSGINPEGILTGCLPYVLRGWLSFHPKIEPKGASLHLCALFFLTLFLKSESLFGGGEAGERCSRVLTKVKTCPQLQKKGFFFFIFDGLLCSCNYFLAHCVGITLWGGNAQQLRTMFGCSLVIGQGRRGCRWASASLDGVLSPEINVYGVSI